MKQYRLNEDDGNKFLRLVCSQRKVETELDEKQGLLLVQSGVRDSEKEPNRTEHFLELKNGDKEPEELSPELLKYRAQLIDTEQKSQDLYDKTVIQLSTGALGLSFAFIEKIVDLNIAIWKWGLIGAWIAWAVSIMAVLFSFAASSAAMRKTIKQVDKNLIYEEKPGGLLDKITECLNVISGTGFGVGVVFMVMFVYLNIGV